MQNKFYCLSFLVFASTANAQIEFSVTAPCRKTSIFTISTTLTEPSSVGSFTLKQLTVSKLPFLADANGVKSIAGTPTDLDIHEIIDDSHMRTYGWCYEVNGKLASELANEFILKPNIPYNIRWFYGYAEYINGDWSPDFCKPLYEHPNQFICK